MTPPEVGGRAPGFALRTAAGGVARAPDADGRRVVLMFFQEALTPTCSAQVNSLVREAALLRDLNAAVICVSTDALERLREFSVELGAVEIALASDPDAAVARAYDIFDAASRRARRAAFVIEPDGTLGLALPWYNPSNSGQLAQIFLHLGLEAKDTGDG